MADNVLGSVKIEISGDYSRLEADFAAASSMAQKAGQKVASNLSNGMESGLKSGAGLVDQFGRSISSVSDIASAAAPKLAKIVQPAVPQFFRNTGAAAQEAGEKVQSFVGLIPGLGVAAERFIGLIPGLGQVLVNLFPALGAIAFATAIVQITGNITELFEGAGKGGAVIHAAFADLIQAGRQTNDELQLSNDKLANESAKIEHKPQNGLKEALDEARVAADKLQQSLAKDLKTIQDIFTANKVGIARQIIGEAGTEDIEERLRAFQVRIAALTEKGNQGIQAATNVPEVGGVSLFAAETSQALKRAAQTKLNTELTKEYTAEVARLQNLLKSAVAAPGGYAVDKSARIALLEGDIASLHEQAKGIGLGSVNANLKGDKEAAQITDAAQKKATEDAKRHTQEMGQADQLALAELKSNHQVTIGEEIRFWQQRLAVESGNVERYRDITMKLGTLNQERDKLITSIAKHGAAVMEAEARKAEQQKAKFVGLALDSEGLANRIAADMVKARERAQENQTMRAAAGAEGAAEGRKLANERAYGLEVVHTLQQQVQHMRELAAIDLEKSNARIAELDSLQKIAAAAGDETKAAQYSLQLERERAAVKNQQYQAETPILELQQKESPRGILRTGLAGAAGADKTLGQKLATTGVSLTTSAIEGVSSALARAAVEGGKVGHMLRDVGKQLAMTAATSVLKMGLQAALQGIMRFVPAFAGVAAAQSAAAATGHAATVANNVGSVLSYAAVGAAAAAASTAAIPIIGPLLAPESAAAIYAMIASFAPLAAFADGGRPEPGKPSIVGERGPEMFIPDSAGRIIPNHQLAGGAGLSFPNAASGGNSIGSMNFHAHGMTNPREFVREVARQLPTYLKSTNPKYSPASR
jgi:hypothetical protein